MQKEIEITFIEDNDLARQNMLNEYSVGSWIILNDQNSSFLCVIAQVDAMMITAIVIEEKGADPWLNRPGDANRMVNPFKMSGTHDKLNDIDITNLTKSGGWTMTKVNVQINVYTKETQQ
jgi:hypothetical protein